MGTIIKPNIIHDAGRVSSDGARLAGCQRGSPGGEAGDYTYTLQNGCAVAASESAILVAVNTTGNFRYADAVQTSSTVFAVRTRSTDGGGADAAAWSFAILNLAF